MSPNNLDEILTRVITHLLTSSTDHFDLGTLQALSPSTTFVEEVLELLENEGLLRLNKGTYVLPQENRVAIIELGFRYGLDYEHFASLISWREFEAFCRKVVESHGYRCYANFRFTVRETRKRFEIDILGVKKPFIIAIDAKHWQVTKGGAQFHNALRMQYERVENLARVLPTKVIELSTNGWGTVQLFPLVVSLFDQRVSITATGAVIPIFKLNQFLLEFDEYHNDLPSLSLTLPFFKPLTEYDKPTS